MKSFCQNQQKEEVDFVVKDGNIKQLIQVCADISAPDVKKRELRPLIKAGKELKCKNLLVITETYEATETHNGNKITFIPLWKWLLIR